MKRSAQIIVCCAQKGGVAKTVTTHNLAVALSQAKKKVLAVDMDYQANLTCCLGIDEPNTLSVGIAQLLEAELHDSELPAPESYIQHCGGVDLIAASTYLSAVSETMRLEMGSERFLADILTPLRPLYDYIVVDTGPKLDNLNINALVAADQVVIPVNPQYLSAMGLERLLATVNKVRRRFNPDIEIAGVLLTMCEKRTNLCQIITEQIRQEYGPVLHVFNATIPMTVKVGESVYYSKSVIEYCPSSPASSAYKAFAQELLEQDKLRIIAKAELRKEDRQNEKKYACASHHS